MKRILFAAVAAAGLTAAVAAASAATGAVGVGALVQAPGDMLHKAGQCQQRVGPYATQTTAWQRWREARYQGYSISNGVTPCYDGYGTRGYCFFVYYGC
ncbi:MAG: hypothetical protein RIM80_11480 [Alphaproteobacteria bacterium]